MTAQQDRHLVPFLSHITWGKKKIESTWEHKYIFMIYKLHTDFLWISQILSCLLSSWKGNVSPKGWIQVLSKQFCANLPWWTPQKLCQRDSLFCQDFVFNLKPLILMDVSFFLFSHLSSYLPHIPCGSIWVTVSLGSRTQTERRL